MDTRLEELKNWITETMHGAEFTVTPLLGDASFRRYFRIQFADHTAIAMDAPPEREESYPFVTIARAFAKLGLRVPQILKENLSIGFLLLTDLGDKLYLKELNSNNADILYGNALQELLVVQACREVHGWALPHFDQRMMGQELDFFSYWFLDRYLNLHLTQKESVTVREAFQFLLDAATEQPQVCVHRDYHSRNLLVLDDCKVGIVDFQDAVWGPLTYDVVSLLRDCYVDWPQEQVQKWALTYLRNAIAANIVPATITPEQFMRWFDLMGIQRHLKATFIFVRKLLRDNHPGYLDDVPRTLNYIHTVAKPYRELQKFNKLFNNVILPKFNEVYLQ